MLLEWYHHCHWRETQTALHLEQLTLYEMVPPTSIVLAATATSWQTVDTQIPVLISQGQTSEPTKLAVHMKHTAFTA